MDVYLNNTAEKKYNNLNKPILQRITKGIDGLENEPPEGDIKPLKGKPGTFRLQIGKFRILYEKRENDILVTDIVSRGQAYDKKHMED